LEITPELLSLIIEQLRKQDVDLVSLDSAVSAIETGAARRRFVTFTLDDGYRDNYLHALPVFEKYDVPFTVYLTTSFPDDDALLWWYLLEDIVRGTNSVTFMDTGAKRITGSEKKATFNELAERLAFGPIEEREKLVELLFSPNAVVAVREREQLLRWSEVEALERHPLATIGAHTISHLALSTLTAPDVAYEIGASVTRIQNATGVAPQHFAYPYGGRAAVGAREFKIARGLGLRSATTTRHGNVFPDHARNMFALPRIPVTKSGFGRFAEYTELWTSGLVAAHENRMRRVVVE